MKIDRRFPPTWSAAHERLYWREWAAVQKVDARADRRALTVRALGVHKSHVEFTDIEFGKVLEAFREISQPQDLIMIVDAADRRKSHLCRVVQRLAQRTETEIGYIADLSEDELDALRIRLSQQLNGARMAA